MWMKQGKCDWAIRWRCVWLACAITLLPAVAPAQEATVVRGGHSIIGFGFYLPDLDMLDTASSLNAGSGIRLFDESFAADCIKEDPDYDGVFKSSSKYFDNYSDAESVIKLTSDGSFDSSYGISYKATLGAQFMNSSRTAMKAKGVLIYAQRLERSFFVHKECTISPQFRQEFIEDFKALPALVPNAPEAKAQKVYDKEFKQYSKFLKKYGTHYVAQLITGSSIYWSSMSRASESFTQQQFEAKACLQAEGEDPLGKMGLKTCEGIDKKTRQETSSVAINVKPIVSGGTPATRAELGTAMPITAEKMKEFFSGSEGNNDGVFFKFEPIWEIIKHDSRLNEDKANDLAAYYALVTGYGCGTKRHGNVILQKFGKAVTADLTEYACLRPLEGCQRNADCHRVISSLCYGKTCIQIKANNTASVKLNDDDTAFNEGENRTCHNDGFGTRCGRNKNSDKPWWNHWRDFEVYDRADS